MLIDPVKVLAVDFLEFGSLVPKFQLGAPLHYGFPVLFEDHLFVSASLPETSHFILQAFHQAMPMLCLGEKALCQSILLKDSKYELAGCFSLDSVNCAFWLPKKSTAVHNASADQIFQYFSSHLLKFTLSFSTLFFRINFEILTDIMSSFRILLLADCTRIFIQKPKNLALDSSSHFVFFDKFLIIFQS